MQRREWDGRPRAVGGGLPASQSAAADPSKPPARNTGPSRAHYHRVEPGGEESPGGRARSPQGPAAVDRATLPSRRRPDSPQQHDRREGPVSDPVKEGPYCQPPAAAPIRSQATLTSRRTHPTASRIEAAGKVGLFKDTVATPNANPASMVTAPREVHRSSSRNEAMAAMRARFPAGETRRPRAECDGRMFIAGRSSPKPALRPHP
jgi:hypothetical protein